MTCEHVRERLDDYLDGALDERLFQEVELHLASCAGCREEERGVRAVIALAAALPREKAPSRDLWPGIAEEIAHRRRFAVLSFVPRRPAIWLGALAAAATVVVAVGVLTPRERPSAGPVALGTPGAVARPAALGGGVPALAEAEREYQRAAAELMAALDTRRASLSPETTASIDENLRVIDTALAEIRAAVEREPDSPRLGRMLASTHEKKIETLRRVLKLTT
jgi:predicted anti-sigma-YlaC factor YlaD